MDMKKLSEYSRRNLFPSQLCHWPCFKILSRTPKRGNVLLFEPQGQTLPLDLIPLLNLLNTRFFLLYIFSEEIKKKTKVWQAVLSLAKRLRHNALLVPHKPPFGTYSDSFWPDCILSCEIAFFFFFPVFLFSFENILCFYIFT